MKKINALVIKEFLQILRDPSSILIAFLMPLILLFVYGYGINLNTNKIKIGVVVEKSEQAAIDLASSFAASRYFDLSLSHDRRFFEDEITAGRLRAMLIIPAGFNRKLSEESQSQGNFNFSSDLLPKHGPSGLALPLGDFEESASLQLITDGSEPNVASLCKAYVEGLLYLWLEQENSRLNGEIPVSVNMIPRFWYNEELNSRFFLIPGSIAIIMTLIGVMLTSLVFAREWDRGTMEALMATPVTMPQIFLGKLIPYFILAMLSMLMCWMVAIYWYDVPFRGSMWALLALSGIFLISALGQGLLISVLTKNQFLASQAALVSGFLPAFMLSGFFFEIAAMPKAIQAVSMILAAKYFVSCLHTIFLAGDVWPLFIRSSVAMLLIGFCFFALTLKNMKKRLA